MRGPHIIMMPLTSMMPLGAHTAPLRIVGKGCSFLLEVTLCWHFSCFLSKWNPFVYGPHVQCPSWTTIDSELTGAIEMCWWAVMTWEIQLGGPCYKPPSKATFTIPVKHPNELVAWFILFTDWSRERSCTFGHLCYSECCLGLVG